MLLHRVKEQAVAPAHQIHRTVHHKGHFAVKDENIFLARVAHQMRLDLPLCRHNQNGLHLMLVAPRRRAVHLIAQRRGHKLRGILKRVDRPHGGLLTFRLDQLRGLHAQRLCDLRQRRQGGNHHAVLHLGDHTLRQSALLRQLLLGHPHASAGAADVAADAKLVAVNRLNLALSHGCILLFPPGMQPTY